MYHVVQGHGFAHAITNEVGFSIGWSLKARQLARQGAKCNLGRCKNPTSSQEQFYAAPQDLLSRAGG